MPSRPPRRAVAILFAITTLASVAVAAPAVRADVPLAAHGLDGAGVYLVEWRVLETVHTFDGRLDEGAQRHLKLKVEQLNVTDIAFVLRWKETDDERGLTQPDTFEVTAANPGGRAAPGSPARSSSGVARVSSGRLNEVPKPLQFEAPSLRDAKDALEEHEGRDGLGAWSVTLSLEDAGNPGGTRVDAGNAYTLTVTLRHYEPVLTRSVALGPPPALSLVQAASTTPGPWLWSALALAAAAVGLGGWLVVDTVRHRRGRS